MNSSYDFREIRIVIEDELTQVYVLLEAHGDSPLGVQGWHHKMFPKSVSALDAVKEAADAVLWPLNAPGGR